MITNSSGVRPTSVQILLAMWLWANLLTISSLCFHICKMEITPASKECLKALLHETFKAL